MMTPPANRSQVEGTSKFEKAVVIGSSIAGLTIARVLTDYFSQVVVIDRDHLPSGPQFRRGVPQARHVHVLRLRGQQILEQQFPGLVDELVTKGALLVNAGNQAEFFLFGQWRGPRYHSKIDSVACGRPLLDTTIYRRLVDHPRVTVIQAHEAAGLTTDAGGKRVTGVRIRPRGESHLKETEIKAELVVDASGRSSKAPQWLANLGYMPPRDTVVNAWPGYTSRIYRRPTNFAEPWETMYIIPTPPDSPRGGVIIPMDRERWLVTMIGMGGDYPPTDERGYVDFARTLPSSRLYEAVKTARPLTKPYSFRRNENRLRHYEKLPHYLDGFLVAGDAVCALNPIHAQGMTVAALGSLALDRCLQGTGTIAGLAKAFQQELAQVVAGPWHMATSTDRRWPATDGGDAPLDPMTRLQQNYFTWVLQTMVHNPNVAEAFFRVQHMVAPPATLFRSDIVEQVLASTAGEEREAIDIQPLLARYQEVNP